MILPKAVKLSFSKLPPNWSYLKVSVVTPVNLDITDIEFKSAIMQSLQVSTAFRNVHYIIWVLNFWCRSCGLISDKRVLIQKVR